MIYGRLSDYFVAVASKFLSTVETDPRQSNQHEFNGVGRLRNLFGDNKLHLNSVKFFYIGESPEDAVVSLGNITWYDARANHPSRTEYRLYYSSNRVMDAASEGDLMVIGRDKSGKYVIVIAEAGSAAEKELAWLFSTPDDSSFGIVDSDKTSIGIVEKLVLNNLELPVEELPGSLLEEMIQRFGNKFPSTREVSLFVREAFPEIITSNSDETLLYCIDKEEMAFRLFEGHLIQDQLSHGFESVDEFEAFAKSWINRRYSRAGHALENHLDYLFETRGIKFCSQKFTEQKKRPDYIFPSIKAYRQLPDELVSKFVTMLAAKKTCKDRWRQVLSEANRLTEKHLVTLEPGISNNQTEEMLASGLRLIIPKPLQSTYASNQRDYLMSLEEFMERVLQRQKTIQYSHAKVLI